MKHDTDEENFWAGEFGDDYIDRNKGNNLLAANLDFFSKALNLTGKIDSSIELGANIGMNLKALKLLYPAINLYGIEINKNAFSELEKLLGKKNAINQSIFDYKAKRKFELVIIKGVLIHINPEKLPLVYQKLYDSSKRYILIAEYYNPSPMKVSYRGHENKLYKRDFAGEFLDLYNDCRLIDYGFIYHRDPSFPQDDITWFLIEKI